jgi:hypothetical protein
MSALDGTELVQVTRVTPGGSPSAVTENTTTQAIANLGGGGSGNLTVGNVANVGNIQVGSGLEASGSDGNVTISATGGGGSLTGVTTDQVTQLGDGGPVEGNIGVNSVIIGSGAGAASTDALTGTVIIGANAGAALVNGSSSTVIGANAATTMTGTNTVVGAFAGNGLTRGEANTLVGQDATTINPDTSAAAVLGAGSSAGSNGVAIGEGIAAGDNATNINNVLVSDGTSTTTVSPPNGVANGAVVLNAVGGGDITLQINGSTASIFLGTPGNISVSVTPTSVVISGLSGSNPHEDGALYTTTIGNITVVAQSQG